MDNLFTARLLERYQQTTPTITPRVSSLFEPDAAQRSVGSAFSPAIQESNEQSSPVVQEISPPGLQVSAPSAPPHTALGDDMPITANHFGNHRSSSPSISLNTSTTDEPQSFSIQPHHPVVPRYLASMTVADSSPERAASPQQTVARSLPTTMPLSPIVTTAVVIPAHVNSETATVKTVALSSAASEEALPSQRQSAFLQPIALPDAPPVLGIARSGGVLSVPESLPLAFPKQEAPQPAQPTINVTIGRLEVRANTAAPTKPRPQTAPRQPVMGLDEYLKNRGGRWS